MKIAQHWKILEHVDVDNKIEVRMKNLGRYTEATARDKMNARYPAPIKRLLRSPDYHIITKTN